MLSGHTRFSFTALPKIVETLHFQVRNSLDQRCNVYSFVRSNTELRTKFFSKVRFEMETFSAPTVRTYVYATVSLGNVN